MSYRSVSFQALLALCFVLVSTTGICMIVRERVPNGTYCGNYASGLVEGNVTTKAGSDTFDMHLHGLGMELNCENEKFIYDPKTHHAVVAGATDPNDCIGKVITENKLSLDVLYDPAKDVITLDVGITKIACKKC